MAKREINYGGQKLMAEEIPFETERENWNTYLLQDGSTLKVKTVLAEVLRVEGQYAPNGDPLYMINASTVVSSAAPEALRRKA